jgi:hypothetical protein
MDAQTVASHEIYLFIQSPLQGQSQHARTGPYPGSDREPGSSILPNLRDKCIALRKRGGKGKKKKKKKKRKKKEEKLGQYRAARQHQI